MKIAELWSMSKRYKFHTGNASQKKKRPVWWYVPFKPVGIILLK